MRDPWALLRSPDLPQLGPRVPGFVLRAVLALVGALLCLLGYQQVFWIVVGLILTAVAAVYPRRLAAWALVLFLGASQLPHDPALSWRFLVLLAGLHLVHVLGAQTLELPWRSWVQLDVFRAPLLRWLAIQVPAQAVAVLALALLAPRSNGTRHVTLPVFGAVGAVALVLLTLLLAVPLLRQRAR